MYVLFSRGLIFTLSVWMLSACAVPVTLPSEPTQLPTRAVLLPTPTLPIPSPQPSVIAPTSVDNPPDGFGRITRSSDRFHLRCDPQEIIFDVYNTSDQVFQVVFLYRVKDKATGLVTPWINLVMRPVGSGMYEILLRPSDLPEDARYWDAWLQVQFVSLDRANNRLDQTAVIADEISYSPRCP